MPGQAGILLSTALGIAMIAVLALTWGAWATWRRGDRRKGVLMLVCAAVIAGNVAIWTV